jgi:Fe-S cluster assembly protein SufD
VEEDTIDCIEADATPEVLVPNGEDPLQDLNRASFGKLLQVKVPRNQQGKPVFIYQIIDNRKDQVVAHPRAFFQLEDNAELKVLEKTVILGEKQVLINKVFEGTVAQNASFNITKYQDPGPSVTEIDQLNIRQVRDSRVYTNTYSFSGSMVRNNIRLLLADEHCEAHMHGFYLLDGKSHVDNHTAVDHQFPNSFSNELYKGIVNDKSHAVFNGKIFVRQDAQQTNAFQSNNNISLSEDAVINTKPQLEIWADDVKCSHGCTIGQIDEEAIFYLRARGLDFNTARMMVLSAFAEDTMEYVPFDFVKETITQQLEKRLK